MHIWCNVYTSGLFLHVYLLDFHYWVGSSVFPRRRNHICWIVNYTGVRVLPLTILFGILSSIPQLPYYVCECSCMSCVFSSVWWDVIPVTSFKLVLSDIYVYVIVLWCGDYAFIYCIFWVQWLKSGHSDFFLHHVQSFMSLLLFCLLSGLLGLLLWCSIWILLLEDSFKR